MKVIGVNRFRRWWFRASSRRHSLRCCCLGGGGTGLTGGYSSWCFVQQSWPVSFIAGMTLVTACRRCRFG